MQCPLSDGELIAHTTSGEKNLTVSYSTCPTCQGYWMTSFAANFIKLAPNEPHRTGVNVPLPTGMNLKCPVCTKELIRALGENIPDTASVYHCPDHHGYFFPEGELAAFKNAQQSKIEFHKLWNIPLMNVGSVLLTGLAILIVGGEILTAYEAAQTHQTTTSQATAPFTGAHAYVVPATHEVLFSIVTHEDATVTVHVPSMNNTSQVLHSTDHRMHSGIIKNIMAGTYTYFFTYSIAGHTVQSDNYTFTMP